MSSNCEIVPYATYNTWHTLEDENDRLQALPISDETAMEDDFEEAAEIDGASFGDFDFAVALRKGREKRDHFKVMDEVRELYLKRYARGLNYVSGKNAATLMSAVGARLSTSMSEGGQVDILVAVDAEMFKYQVDQIVADAVEQHSFSHDFIRTNQDFKTGITKLRNDLLHVQNTISTVNTIVLQHRFDTTTGQWFHRLLTVQKTVGQDAIYLAVGRCSLYYLFNEQSPGCLSCLYRMPVPALPDPAYIQNQLRLTSLSMLQKEAASQQPYVITKGIRWVRELCSTALQFAVESKMQQSIESD